ncbi:GDSL-type esterase/lipase family protein [Pontibacter sp. E15-1]|uniref:GDSL-type esterase/lipase family protein n=1 Tax=Pontibacter sp. E15-1 TaxID=2919918 RepID=UPI001F4F840C|nr:GDSL-type esterase/lipase family protein [Pontibacter sp. E15-1]MCJ8165694.1 GDSL-type esterase/lipase family protein [Pontibacter sp. E15-1]
MPPVFAAMMRFILLLCLALPAVFPAMGQSASRGKVACIGNSVTYGYGIENREEYAYPAQLQALLGPGYEVANFGQSGATLLREGHRPYASTQQYKEALAYRPDIAVIHLGLNDTDPRNWPNYRDAFAADYGHLIDTLRAVNPQVRILICRLTPIFSGHPRFASGTREWFWQIQALIPFIAEGRRVELIDLHTPLYHRPDLFPDELHPTKEGAAILAATVYTSITGKYGGLQLAPVYADHMVLQQKVPLPVYGIADAGQEVTVSFGSERGTATAGANGKWAVMLPALKAGGPFRMEVSTQDTSISISDVLVGEVWLCAGQSNMAFPLRQAVHTGPELVAAQQASTIRLLQMKPMAETADIAWDSATLQKVNQLQYFSGTWQRGDSATAKDFSAVAYYFGKRLQERLGVPVGLIQVAVGGSGTESWIDRYTLERHPQLVGMLHGWRDSDFLMPWVRERASRNLGNATLPKQRHPYQPAYSFEAGVAPLTGFPIKGVIWYQGESNTHNSELHETLFKTLVQSWREQWGYAFPFYYVQLSGINRPSWPYFRDSQRQLLQQIPNAGMAVSTDLGDSLDVHPRQKRQVGERLAGWALARTYGRQVPYSGPLFQRARIKGNRAVCSFAHSKGMRASDGQALRGFEVAGSDLVFSKAKAVVSGSKVRVWSGRVPEPKYVRYAWQPYTTANLVNKANLPAATFSSFTITER